MADQHWQTPCFQKNVVPDKADQMSHPGEALESPRICYARQRQNQVTPERDIILDQRTRSERFQ
jgi:hypothetical protein